MLVWLPLVAALSLNLRSRSPVEKVVELIKELKAKIDTDAAAEQKIYDKFACWCETTTKRKADSIEAGKATIGTTTTKILTLKGATAVLATEIGELEAKIAKNNEAMKKLTSIREKENSDYQAEKANLETSVNSLHQAIQVLSGAGTGGDLGLLAVAARVRSAVLRSSHLAAMPHHKQAILKAFLQNPAAADYYDKKAQAKASYSPQSATVTGILKDMYDTFAANIQSANEAESNAQKAFEDVMEEKEDQNKLDRKMATAKEAKKADRSQQLAENEQKLQNAQVSLADDEAIFDVTRDSCKAKSDSWDERCRSRTEELDGISKALAILTSDTARATLAAATETRPQDTFGSAGTDVLFVQLATSQDPRAVAYRALKQAGGATQSLRLARIAATVRTASMGHFDSVIESIDDTLSELAAEEADDIKQKKWCFEETTKQRNHQTDLEYAIEQLAAKISRGQTYKAALEADHARVTQEKADLAGSLAQAEDDREAEHNAYVTAKADDETAIGLLADAEAAMSEHSKNYALLQRDEPVFEVSEDDAPDATFSSEDNHSGHTNGIIALLKQLQENLANEVKLGDAAEAKAARENAALQGSAGAMEKEYDVELITLNTNIAKTDAAILDDQDAKTDVEGERDSTVTYLKRINPNCSWIQGPAFEKRAAARGQESEGLNQAKATLASA